VDSIRHDIMEFRDSEIVYIITVSEIWCFWINSWNYTLFMCWNKYSSFQENSDTYTVHLITV